MIRKKIMGLVMISFGAGMLVVLFIPGWGFLFAAGLIAVGFWNLFLC